MPATEPVVARIIYDDARFNSTVSSDCDPDYLIDPHVPSKARSSRVIYGDGPDLAYGRALWDADPANVGRFTSREYANHEYGAVALFYDSHVKFILSDDDGVTPNRSLIDSDFVVGTLLTMDTDIYGDGNWNLGANWDDDEVVDCNLGNSIDRADDTEDDTWDTGPDLAPIDDWDVIP